MTNGKPKTRTITLTDRAPVRIKEDEWPILAHGSYSHHDGQIRQQANRLHDIDIRVRQHADGRAIVYGVYEYDTHFPHERNEVHKVGVLLDAGGDLPRAIKAIATQLTERVSDEDMHPNIRDAANECIAGLPAEEI